MRRLSLGAVAALCLAAFVPGPRPAPKRAVVSGLSIVGLMTTATLAKAGWQVDAYELRPAYTRNIQWAARQALVDQLAALDPQLAARFLKDVASPLPKGSLHISEKGRVPWPVAAPLAGDATRLPRTGQEMIAAPSLMNLEAKVFETFLMEYVQSLPNVTVHRPDSIKVTGPDSGGRYGVAGLGTPDLIVISEGAGSSTRKHLGIGSLPASPARAQVAGALLFRSGGSMTKHYLRDADGRLLLTGTMGRAASERTWIVADLPAGFDTSKPDAVTAEFRRRAALALEQPLAAIEACRALGPVEEAGAPKCFTLEQHVSTAVTAGTNVVLMGDAARNGHWSVGGGMQTGSICDVEALKGLLKDLENGQPRAASLAKFSGRIYEHSLAWLRIGICDFFPEHERAVATRAFDAAWREWQAGRATSPQEALERQETKPSQYSAAPEMLVKVTPAKMM